MNAAYFAMGIASTLAVVLLVQWREDARSRRTQDALDASYRIIEVLHTRLLDPAAAAAQDLHVASNNAFIASQLAMELGASTDPFAPPPESDGLARGANGKTSLSERDLEDLV